MANPKAGKDLLQEWERFVENRDAQAFHELYIGYYHYFQLLGLKRGISTSVTEDAISDIFLYLWENPQKLRSVRNHHNYLVTSFINKLAGKKGFNEDRNVDLMEVAELFAVPSPEYDHIAANVKDSVSQIVKHYIDRLPAQQGLMIYQKFYLGLSYNEISAANDVSLRTAYNTVSIAVNTLKTLLGKEKGVIFGFFMMIGIIFYLFFNITGKF